MSRAEKIKELETELSDLGGKKSGDKGFLEQFWNGGKSIQQMKDYTNEKLKLLEAGGANPEFKDDILDHSDKQKNMMSDYESKIAALEDEIKKTSGMPKEDWMSSDWKDNTINAIKRKMAVFQKELGLIKQSPGGKVIKPSQQRLAQIKAFKKDISNWDNYLKNPPKTVEDMVKANSSSMNKAPTITADFLNKAVDDWDKQYDAKIAFNTKLLESLKDPKSGSSYDTPEEAAAAEREARNTPEYKAWLNSGSQSAEQAKSQMALEEKKALGVEQQPQTLKEATQAVKQADQKAQPIQSVDPLGGMTPEQYANQGLPGGTPAQTFSPTQGLGLRNAIQQTTPPGTIPLTGIVPPPPSSQPGTPTPTGTGVGGVSPMGVAGGASPGAGGQPNNIRNATRSMLSSQTPSPTQTQPSSMLTANAGLGGSGGGSDDSGSNLMTFSNMRKDKLKSRYNLQSSGAGWGQNNSSY